MATCKDCLHFEVCDSGRHIGEYEIDDGVYSDGVENQCLAFKNKADFVEVKHGEWSRGAEPSGSVYAHCSACNRKMNSYCYGYAHCPLCGAKMDGTPKERGADNG